MKQKYTDERDISNDETTLTLNKLKKTVSISTLSTNLVPQYVKYAFEYHRIPNSYKIIFTDKTFTNLAEFIEKGENR